MCSNDKLDLFQKDNGTPLSSAVRSDLARGKRDQKEHPGAEAAELTRDVLSVVAHELGGIAGALDLRATALTGTTPDPDLKALRGLAEELRVATRAVRLARGTDGIGTLGASKPQTLENWWKLVSRFTAIVLPRGVVVDSGFSGGQVSPSQSPSLTWLWLAACKDLGERGIITPATLTLRGNAVGNGDEGVTLVAEMRVDRLTTPESATSRWARYGGAIATELGTSAPAWERDGDLLRWQCVIR